MLFGACMGMYNGTFVYFIRKLVWGWLFTLLSWVCPHGSALKKCTSVDMFLNVYVFLFVFVRVYVCVWH